MSQKRSSKQSLSKIFIRLLSKLQTILFPILIFLLPTQLAFHFWPKFAFIFGIKVDYLAPSVYLSDLFVLVLIFSWFLELLIDKKIKLKLKHSNKSYFLLTLFFVFVLLNICLAIIPQVALYKWFKILEIFLLATYVSQRKSLDILKEVVFPLSLSVVFFGLIGILQFVFQKTLGGALYLFGERSFNASTPGIALFSFQGKDYLRAYSTFSHPNSLAGYFASVILLVLMYPFKQIKSIPSRLFLIILGLIGCICLFLTFSRSVAASTLISLVLVSLPKKINNRGINMLIFIFLFLSFFQSTILKHLVDIDLFMDKNIIERINLLGCSGKMVAKNFVFGVGLGNFIPELVKIGCAQKGMWLLQPVHNLFLLVFSETGIIGLILVTLFLLKVLKIILTNKNKSFLLGALLIILISGFFDHYWLTLQQNMLLLSIIFGLTFRNNTA